MGFETIKNIMDENKAEEERGKQEAMSPTECPNCAWPLEENSKGQKICPVCERIWK